MSNIILTGATGTAGSGILMRALDSPLINRVTVISRRPLPITHAKLATVLVPSEEYPKGFDEWPASLVDKLKGNDAMIWALGISQTQVKEDEYIKITYDYTVSAATALKSLGTPTSPFRFIYVSGMGADQTEKSWQLFGRIKGRAEKWLKDNETESFKTVSLRPGGINQTPEQAARVQLPFLQRVGLGLGNLVYSSGMIGAEDIGTAAVALAAGKGWENRDAAESWIDNAVLKKMAKEYDSAMHA